MRLRRRSRRNRAASSDGAHDPDPRIAELQHRLEHLELAFEGLQDAVHRDAVRRHQELEELRKSTQPDAMARSLSESARQRGI